MQYQAIGLSWNMLSQIRRLDILCQCNSGEAVPEKGALSANTRPAKGVAL